jgi:ABC-type multidrug transport system fused ATPase/permease subunit
MNFSAEPFILRCNITLLLSEGKCYYVSRYFHHRSGTLAPMRTWYPYLRTFLPAFKLGLISLTVIFFCQMALAIVFPLPGRFILNEVIKGDSNSVHQIAFQGISLGSYQGFSALLFLSTVAFAISLAMVVFGWLEQIANGGMVLELQKRVRRDLFIKVFTRRQSYLDRKRKVDLLGRISGDAGNLDVLFLHFFPTIVRDVPMIIVLTAIMFTIDVELSLAFTACLPFFYLFGYYFTGKMRLAAREVRRKTTSFEEDTHEALSAVAVVKSMRGESRLFSKYDERLTQVLGAGIQERNANANLEASLQTTQYLVHCGFILLGSWALLKGTLGWGHLFQMITYMQLISRHVNAITKFVSKYPKCVASMERIEELHRELELNPELEGSKDVPKNEGLRFDSVSFRYSDDAPWIFRDYSQTFPKNKFIAVVGASGIGKSSFSRLLNRLQDPLSGTISLGQVDLKELRLESLRKYVRVYAQDSFLISGTVRENLGLAVSRVLGPEEAERVLAPVNAAEFIHALPAGLETKIGEGGQQLSGGQAKRISLARALVDTEGQIVVFDEPTTGLDTLSSQIVLESIAAERNKRSLVFWVTHRMQEVFRADLVLFFAQGRNPILSSHEDLYRSDTGYRSLVDQPQPSPIPAKTPSLPSRSSSSEDDQNAESTLNLDLATIRLPRNEGNQ